MEKKKPNAQQQLQEMANLVVKSHLRFARNSVVAEKSRSRTLPLLVAAKRWQKIWLKIGDKEFLKAKKSKLMVGITETATLKPESR